VVEVDFLQLLKQLDVVHVGLWRICI